MCRIECVCARLYAAASHQSSLIVARLFSTLQKKVVRLAHYRYYFYVAPVMMKLTVGVCIPPAESIIVARSSRSSQCLLFCFSFLVCVQFFAQNTHTDVILFIFLFFFCFSNSFFCFGHWPLLFVAWTTLVLHCVAMVPESTNTQQARFCSFFKKLLFRWENSTFGCCYHRICGIRFFLKLSPAVCGRKIERCSIEKVFVYLRF